MIMPYLKIDKQKQTPEQRKKNWIHMNKFKNLRIKDITLPWQWPDF